MAESFGRYIRRERELREITLEEISQYTKIKLATLIALEEDRFPNLPAIAFVRGFVRSYAEYLGLDPRDVILRLDHFLLENYPEKTAPPIIPLKKTLTQTRLRLLFFGFVLTAFFFSATTTPIVT